MRKKETVSSFVRVQVVALHGTGFNQVHISKQLNILLCCVKNAINKYKHLGIYEGLKRSERPKKVYAQNLRCLKRLVKGDAHLNATKTASDLNASLPKSVTTQIVRTYLKELGFEYVVKVKKQSIGIQHRQQ